MKGFQADLKKEITSFDGDAWEEAVKESGIEVVENDAEDDVPEYTQTAVEQIPSEIPEISETKVTEEKETSPKAKSNEEVTVVEEVATKEKTFSMKKPCKGEVVAECSLDELVFYETTNDWRTHNGVDFLADEGDPVYATADGVVSHIYEDELLGTVLMLDHKNGVVSVYGNIQNPNFMKVGTAVLKGDVVGGVGKTGILEKKANMHLHFEVLNNGELVNPLEYMTSN